MVERKYVLQAGESGFWQIGPLRIRIARAIIVNPESAVSLPGHEEIQAALDDAGIEIPFPRRTLYTGSQTDPFPVQIIDPGRQ